MEEILLKIEGLSKSFGENQVLKNINMEVRTGEIIGLVGENGAGKSTLMKIIFGMPVIASTGGYNGKILFQGKEINFSSSFDALESGIGMVHQEFSLIPGFTASENIVLNRETTNKSIFKELFGEKLNQLNMEKIEERATVAFSHLRVQINPETVVSEMSVAHKQFTEIAREIERKNTKLLILDEPTAVLTETEADILLKTMRRLADEGISILFITHRLDEIMTVCDKVVVLRDGVLINEISTKETNVNEITEWMIGRKIDHTKKKRKNFSEEKNILDIENLWVDMPGEIVKNVNLKVKKGEILGIGGMAGQGKIGIANGVMGLATSGGTIKFNGESLQLNTPIDQLKKGLYFVSEDRKGVGLILDKSIDENIAYPAIEIKNEFLKKKLGGLFQVIDDKEIEKNSKKYIEKLEIRCTNGKQKTGELSGGNQQKVCLAKAFTMNPEVLFVSEPTRGIDVGAKKLVLETLREYNEEKGTTIIITSSEIEELRDICHRIAIVTEGEIAGILSPEDNLLKFGKMMVGLKGEENE
ncbi:MAG: sugar ABC transporter ATP-binding protein [Cetobacterium sp.]|uniref:sugar ABC transporter ATP-binding protein n=1 Tax=Cetobacterium sp. TaxID=2071632 RepID=UPI002FC93385